MDITCAICLESFTPNCEVSNTPCGHLFHTLCIFKSVTNSQNTCPTCRQPCGQLTNIRRVYLQGEIGEQVSSQQGPQKSAQKGAQAVFQSGQQSAQLSAQTTSQPGPPQVVQAVTQQDAQQPLYAQYNNAMQALSLAVARAQQSAQTDPQPGPPQVVQPVTRQDAHLPLYAQ